MQRPDGLDKQSDRLQIVTWTFGLLTILVSTGAGFVWGYERHVRSYTQYMRDRLVRLTFAGATFFQGTEDEYHNWMKSKRSGSVPSQLNFELGHLFEDDQPLIPPETGILIRYEDVTYISVIISDKSTQR